jgi:O-antigen ligase
MIKFIVAFVIYLLHYSSSNFVLKIFPTIIFSVFIFDNIFNVKKKNNKLKFDFTFVLFYFVIIIAALRNSNPSHSGEFNWLRVINFSLILILFGQTFKAYYRLSDTLLFFIKTIVMPLFILVILNFLGYLLNINNEDNVGIASGESVAVMMSGIGIHMTRVNFPFSPGYNSYSSLIGILFFISLYGVFFIRRYRRFFFLLVIVSMLTILFVDTRSAFLIPLFLIPLFYVLRKTKKPKIKLLPLITVFGNIIIISLLTIVSQIPELSFLERSSGDLETGNSRVIIWGFSALEFFNFKWIHLVGYGEYGHYASGASQGWAYIFSKWENPEFTSPHSTLFLILFDYGYLGLLLVVLMQYKIIKAVKCFWNVSRSMSILLISFFLYWNFIGMTESFFGLYTNKIMIVFTLISFYSIQIENFKNNQV